MTKQDSKVNSKCIFTIDVEDWFHILDVPSTPKFHEWESLPSHVEKNFIKILDIFEAGNVRTTCFFLGWVAERFPGLVREACSRGHEIASHGYSHKLVYEMTEREFFIDAKKSKDILEDIIGTRVLGYRASGFSVTEKTPWYFDKLMETGYRYDSSVFPASRGHGGMRTGRFGPYIIEGDGKHLVEFPITVARQFGMPICFFGGGYLRLFPYFIIKRKALEVLKENRPVIFYIHPREIEPGHPRLAMNMTRRFKSYVNISSTEYKLKCIVDDFQFTTFKDYIHGGL